MALSRNQQGQISIFFSASLIVLISIVAFVINVGLFVKAKINLQNATDAAAFSGAAVQARQLTKIAYLNWEMRNIYKEWMYKYYVVGNLNIAAVANPTGSTPMDFRLEKDTNVLSGEENEDPYNFPAVCIHLAGSKTNICKRYAIPGLPEFGAYNLPGAEEASRAFIDSLIGTKINDCIDRTRLNALVTSTWAYNVLTSASEVDSTLAGQGPAILADRQGAWPKAVELAIRMRNLEYIVNRESQPGICIQTGNGTATNCTRSIGDVEDQKKAGNERVIKAFYAGYRNLGNHIDKEMKQTFTLTELPPKKIKLGGQNSASYLLVPQNRVTDYEKQYLDLKLMMVNYAVFYAAMIPRASSDTSGACDVSKVAIPVPGYPLGFYKNPDLVTYYAVRGEAEFVGMFNPFSNESIKLTAYAAAKPFGGRIGPMLFTQREGTDYFTGRTDNSKYRSVPYIASLDFVGTRIKGGNGATLPNGKFTPGTPLPINFDSDTPGYFWLKTPQSPVGGLGASSQGVQFGIPNMVYEFEDGFSNAGYQESGSQIHIIKPADGTGGDKNMGLFSRNQFKAFKGSIGGIVTPDALKQEIQRVRAATTYEAANYMIPTPFWFNKENDVDSFGWIAGGKTAPSPNGTSVNTVDIFAPLYRSGDQTDVLFETLDSVVATIFEFMRAQRNGIDKYKNSLNAGARAVYDMRLVVANSGAAGTVEKYAESAAGISDIDFNQPSTGDSDQIPKTCKSIAGQFLSFYYGDPALYPGQYVTNDGVSNGCPVPLGTMLRTYFASSTSASGFSPSHYRMEYSFKEDNMTKSPAGKLGILSAYMPGPWTGVGDDGRFTSPFPGSGISELMRRNFYSTKLVPLGALQGGPGFSESATNLVIYSEGNLVKQQSPDTTQTDFKNILDGSIDVNSIKY